MNVQRVNCFGLLLLALTPGAGTAAEKTNFVVVLCDDLGCGDLGCFGHPVIKTPNLDRLAAEGMRLTACYSACAVCSPSRAALMTGRTPYRVGIPTHIPWGSPVHLRRSEITVARLLRDAGYATCQVGKWHMNGRFNTPDQPQPSDHGFDDWFATQNNALPNHWNPDNFVRNGRPVGPLVGYSSELIASEAIGWLRTKRPANRPFLLYVAFHAPHEPIATPKALMDEYPWPDDPKRAVYYGNVTHMDRELGRLLSALDELKLRDNTFVFFMSDNGPAYRVPYPYGSAGPLRCKKGHLYEGGIRVPGIWRWPGHVRPGTTSDEPVCGVDMLPTICAIAGLKVPDDRPIDGASFLPVAEGQPVVRNRPLYWEYDRATDWAKIALRQGDWKVLARLTPELGRSQDITPEDLEIIRTAEPDGFELYNLREDPSETTDVAAVEPERLRAMARLLVDTFHEVRHESPVWPAWTAPSYERDHIRWFKVEEAR